jgi:hypothetical protein
MQRSTSATFRSSHNIKNLLHSSWRRVTNGNGRAQRLDVSSFWLVCRPGAQARGKMTLLFHQREVAC